MLSSMVELPENQTIAKLAAEIGRILANSSKIKLFFSIDTISIEHEEFGGAAKSRTNLMMRQRTRIKWAKALWKSLFALCTHWHIEVRYMTVEDMAYYAPDDASEADFVLAEPNYKDKLLERYPDKGVPMMEALQGFHYDVQRIHVSLTNYMVAFQDGSFFVEPTPERLTIGELRDIIKDISVQAPEDKVILQTRTYSRIDFDGKWRLA